MELKANYQIDFKEKKTGFGSYHLYGVNGIYYPSVTSITGLLDNGKSGALIYWAKSQVIASVKEKINNILGKKVIINQKFIEENINLSFLKDKEALELAGNWGTQAHNAIDAFIVKKNPTEHLKSLEAKCAFENFKKMLEENEIKFVSGDIPVASIYYGFGGRLDALAITETNELILWDWKTSNAIKEDYHFQVAGYAIAFEETYSKKISSAKIARFSKGFNLQDKKGKTIKDFEIQDVNLEISKKGFLALLELKNILKYFKEKI